ncbi:MAG: hypothetical protein AAF333_11770 [Planctomycetota bacterium]
MAEPTIQCPNCGKAYRWQTKIAGRNVRCVCQHKFRVPMTPGGVVESDLNASASKASPASTMPKPVPPAKEPDPYELDLPDDDASAAPPQRQTSGLSGRGADPTKCPSCNSPLRPGAVICLNCGFNVAEGSKIQTVVAAAPDDDDTETPTRGGAAAAAAGTEAALQQDRVNRALSRSKLEDDLAADMAQRHHVQENILPLIFLGCGLVLLLINAFVLVPMQDGIYDVPFGLSLSIGAVIVYIILFAIQMPCLFAGILIISKLFGSAFGELFTALKKLAALALLGGQFDAMVELGFDIMLEGLGFLAFWVKLSLSFAVFWALAKQLFDELEPIETVVLWLAMLFLPGFILGGVLLFLLGSL